MDLLRAASGCGLSDVVAPETVAGAGSHVYVVGWAGVRTATNQGLADWAQCIQARGGLSSVGVSQLTTGFLSSPTYKVNATLEIPLTLGAFAQLVSDGFRACTGVALQVQGTGVDWAAPDSVVHTGDQTQPTASSGDVFGQIGGALDSLGASFGGVSPVILIGAAALVLILLIKK